MKFLGIYREPDYSPGRHTSNDARILRLVGQALQQAGISVDLLSLDEARPKRSSYDLIFSMCQGPEAVRELQGWRQEGRVIFNDPVASERTYRDHLCGLLQSKKIAFPLHRFLWTDKPAPSDVAPLFETGGAWLKRPDVHAMREGDVIFLKTPAELSAGLTHFKDRGLSQAVLQQHIVGDEVKFYAVRGDRLFWPFYPKDCEGYPFDEKALQTLAESAADVLGVGIYGGDAIISPEGKITLIDVNDWPSFAPCRGAAAKAIATYLKDMFHVSASSHQLAGS